MSGEDNAHAPMRLIKRRVLINSSDRVSGTTADYAVELKPALQNIVTADWVATTATGGVTIRIDELTQTGVTTANNQYWRYLSEPVNTRYNKIGEAFEPPRAYNRLGIHWRNPDGSVVSGTTVTSTITTSTIGASWTSNYAYNVGDQVNYNSTRYMSQWAVVI